MFLLLLVLKILALVKVNLEEHLAELVENVIFVLLESVGYPCPYAAPEDEQNAENEDIHIGVVEVDGEGESGYCQHCENPEAVETFHILMGWRALVTFPNHDAKLILFAEFTKLFQLKSVKGIDISRQSPRWQSLMQPWFRSLQRVR